MNNLRWESVEGEGGLRHRLFLDDKLVGRVIQTGDGLFTASQYGTTLGQFRTLDSAKEAVECDLLD